MATAGDIRRARRKAVGGKRDRCRKGKSCSAACVARWKECLADMPEPVQGALPRAVRAIQERRPKVGPKERRQAQQVRREQIKGKLAEQRKNFVKKRNSLRVQIQRAIFSEEYTKEGELRDKLKRLEDEVGARLKVPKSASIEKEEVLGRLRKARDSFRDNLMGLSRKVNTAAGHDYKDRPNRRLYDQLENKLISLVRKKESPLWAGPDMRTYKSYFNGLQKGQVWDQKALERKINRKSKLKGVYDGLVKEALKAANDGDRRKYLDAERKILKISERAGEKYGLGEKPTKGSFWREARVPKTLKKLMDSMDNALAFGSLDEYKKLESKFLKVRDGYVGGNQRRSDLLWMAHGPKMNYGKGQLLNEKLDDFRGQLASLARSKNRGEYNRLEKRFLRLKPDEKKGGVWREELARKVGEYLPVLRSKMSKAISDNDRRAYNKLEKVLMRLDPMEKKGRMWREARLNRYLPTLEDKLIKAAINGNRKEYDKLERVLMRADPNGVNSVRGRVWRKERVNLVADKLRSEMEKAIRDDNRARYDRLEAKLLRMRDRAATSLRDYDMRYMSRGDMWRAEKGKTMVADLESSLNKGKREGVDRIQINGNASGFTVSSKVLGNSLDLDINPGSSTSFRVNGSYTATDNLSKREVIAITREVSRQYEEIMKNMEEGTVFRVTAASGDERKDMRIKAYTRFGFSDPDYNGGMYGIVRNGRVEPIDEDEYYDLRS